MFKNPIVLSGLVVVLVVLLLLLGSMLFGTNPQARIDTYATITAIYANAGYR